MSKLIAGVFFVMFLFFSMNGVLHFMKSQVQQIEKSFHNSASLSTLDAEF